MMQKALVLVRESTDGGMVRCGPDWPAQLILQPGLPANWDLVPALLGTS